jgi:NAD(P)-dependent dehydrogenase (short-subunit alcohol dehydrogenase family)
MTPAPAAQLLAGRVAIVTGAAVGIGAGIAHALARNGALVVAVDVDAEQLDKTVGTIAQRGGPNPEPVVADVTNAGTPGIVRDIADSLGGADILVNNVGDFRPDGVFAATGRVHWQRMYDINFGHVLAMTHAVLEGMIQRGRGSIVNVSSVEGLRGIPRNAVYGAMKAAVISFTASLAAEVGQYGVRVNCLAPDLTDTPQTPLSSVLGDRWADHVGKWIPVGRFGVPDDHGNAAVFLVSDQAGFITGTTLRVDGGTMAAPGWLRRGADKFTNLPRPLQ